MSEKTKATLFTCVKAILSALVVCVSSLIGERIGDSSIAMIGASVGTSVAVL